MGCERKGRAEDDSRVPDPAAERLEVLLAGLRKTEGSGLGARKVRNSDQSPLSLRYHWLFKRRFSGQ